MKKHDEGYVLPFVLVVTLVLAIVATSILTAALRNFNAQQQSIAQMEDRYAAQGEIEKIVAQMASGKVKLPEDGSVVLAGDTITVTKGQVVITCVITGANFANTNDGNYSCLVMSNPTYASYTISIVEADAPTETGGAPE